MKGIPTLMTLLVLSVGGCNSGDSASANNELSQSTSTTGAASPTGYYYEKEVDGRIYVVGSKEAAQKLDKGDHPTVAVTKIGYGPDRETVVFEADKSEVEKRLMAEYNRRHKK